MLERLAYEAFGKRRFPNGTDDPNNTLAGITSDRGFTMHEHLDELTLIHMNGRIYDPLLARFITPDPFVQNPSNLQSYNRYSYVYNNPLRNFDPSGFMPNAGQNNNIDWAALGSTVRRGGPPCTNCPDDGGLFGDSINDLVDVVRDNLPVILAIGAAIVTHGAAMTLIGSKVVAGAAAGFVGGYVGSGGNIEAAIIGGIGGAALGAIGLNLGGTQAVVAKSAVGCLTASAGGGSCLAGAGSAGLSEMAGANLPADPVVQLVSSAAIGGTVSKLNGGTFANGATTASFAYVLGDQFRGTENAAGRPLNELEREQLVGSISTDIMDSARVVEDKMPFWTTANRRAITLGNDIYIAPNQYDVAVLAHELVHVGQFSTGTTYTEYVYESFRARGAGSNNRIEGPGITMQKEWERLIWP